MLHHDTSSEKSTWSGLCFKAMLLSIMALQNTVLNLVARRSLVEATVDGGNAFSKTSVVLVCELCKIVFAFILYTFSGRHDLTEGRGSKIFPVRAAAKKVWRITTHQPLELIKLLVPSFLYVVQNNLVLLAAENLEGPLLSVFGQMKIVTAAIFSVIMLKKKLNRQKWIAILLLFVGVCSVQVSQMQDPKLPRFLMEEEKLLIKDKEPYTAGSPVDGTELKYAKKEALSGDGGRKNLPLGLQAVTGAVLISGFAGVYFERVLKESDISVWIRNIHLGFFGAIGAAGVIWWTPTERSHVETQGLFAGYTGIVWCLVFVQAGGGLIVAAVVKYTDNILKIFSTSVSIILVCATSILFLGFPTSILFFVGATLTVLSIFLYGEIINIPHAQKDSNLSKQ